MKDTITLAELRQTELYRREQTRPLREFLKEIEMTTFTTQDRQEAQRTPLTDEKLGKLALSSGAWRSPKSGHIYPDDMNFIEFARAIERAHGIGE